MLQNLFFKFHLFNIHSWRYIDWSPSMVSKRRHKDHRRHYWFISIGSLIIHYRRYLLTNDCFELVNILSCLLFLFSFFRDFQIYKSSDLNSILSAVLFNSFTSVKSFFRRSFKNSDFFLSYGSLCMCWKYSYAHTRQPKIFFKLIDF